MCSVIPNGNRQSSYLIFSIGQLDGVDLDIWAQVRPHTNYEFLPASMLLVKDFFYLIWKPEVQMTYG